MTPHITEQDFTPTHAENWTVTRFVASDGFDAVILTVQGIEVEIPTTIAGDVVDAITEAKGVNIPPPPGE